MAFYDYRIASGYNTALVSLTNIENITPPGGKAYRAPKAYGLQDEGVIKILGNGLDYHSGFPFVIWRFDVLSWVQYEYLKTTYCGGINGLRGKVTIYTRTNYTSNTYTRYNAVIVLPKRIDTDGEFYAPKRVDVLMTRLATPS